MVVWGEAGLAHAGFELMPGTGKRWHVGFLISLPRCGETGREGGAFNDQQLDIRIGAKLVCCGAPPRMVVLDAGHLPWSSREGGDFVGLTAPAL